MNVVYRCTSGHEQSLLPFLFTDANITLTKKSNKRKFDGTTTISVYVAYKALKNTLCTRFLMCMSLWRPVIFIKERKKNLRGAQKVEVIFFDI